MEVEGDSRLVINTMRKLKQWNIMGESEPKLEDISPYLGDRGAHIQVQLSNN